MKPTENGLLPPSVPIYPLTVRQYLRMVEVDILGAYDRVELLEGLLVPKKPHTPPHNAKTSYLTHALNKLLPNQWLVHCQAAIATSDSVPEPDVSVVENHKAEYFKRHPNASETALAVEVSDVTLTIDSVVKRRIYARAKVPVFWLINLPDFRVEVYSDPKAGKLADYRRCEILKDGDQVPLQFNGVRKISLKVADMLFLRKTDK